MKKVIVLAVSLCMCLGLLAGCQSVLSPTQTTDSYLSALKAQDTAAAEKVYAGNITDFQTKLTEEGGDSDFTLSMNDQVFPKLLEFDYELSNEQINGDTATVDVNLTTYALGSAMTSTMTNYMGQAFALAFSGASEDQMSALFQSLFDEQLNTMTKSYSKTVTLSLTKTDGKWMVDDLSSNKDFQDAFLGGLVSSYEGISNAFSSSSTDSSDAAA